MSIGYLNEIRYPKQTEDSLGMVGALSIVRFRTAIKDPMDLLYLFWAITTGITAGAGMYVLALLAAVIMILMIVLFYHKQQRGKIYIAVIHYTGDQAGDEVIRCFGKRKQYDGEYGKGYSPDYNNKVFIEEHEKVIKALGEYFGKDGLISYIELGSLGHWGEWHVNYSEGITRIPEEAVRNQYVMPWLEAFPGVNMLMRRPFHIAEAYGMGLYNDMIGHKESTEEWLTWIQEGRDYGQAEEKDALGSMPDFWKTAPSGGEFTSSVSMEQMLVTDLEQTVELVRKSHTTFLGPKYADSQYKDGYDKVLLNMGYRLWISEAAWKREGQEDCLCLTWNNDGVAPFYKNWPVYLYLEDPSGNTVEKTEINMLLSSVLPDTQLITRTVFETQDIPALLKEGYALSVGIEDPMTEKPGVRLAMDCAYQNGRNILWQKEKQSGFRSLCFRKNR